MLAFYDNKIVKDNKNKIAIDNKLYGALQKNLYTFLYFLIDSINFRINNDVGLQHYSYWHTFLLKVDFSGNSNYMDPIPPTKYRYSCIECIPSDTLREKMRTTLEKKFVTLEKHFTISDIKSISGRAMSSISGAPRPPKVNYFGFCSEEVLTICKNYNDNIMRLIELNMYILIKSAYDNRKMIPILKYTNENVSAEFSKAVFSTTLITQSVEKEFRNTFSAEVDTTTKQKTVNQILPKVEVFSRVYKKFDKDPELRVSFDFLIQLNRIISELQHPDFMGNLSNTSNKITSSSYVANKAIRFTSSAVGLVGNTAGNAAGLIKSSVNFIISDTKLQYEELLREYTLMTGNFLMLTSSFILDKTKLNNNETEQVNNQVTEKLKSLKGAIDTVTNNINESAQSVAKTAEDMDDERLPVGEYSPVNPQGASEGGRSLSKKKI